MTRSPTPPPAAVAVGGGVGDRVIQAGVAGAAAYGYCRSHSRWFYGMRLHAVFAPDGTPRAAMLVGADRPEREIALSMLPAALRGGETVIADKGYAGRDFAESVAQLGGTLLRPARKDEPHTGPQ